MIAAPKMQVAASKSELKVSQTGFVHIKIFGEPPVRFLVHIVTQEDDAKQLTLHLCWSDTAEVCG